MKRTGSFEGSSPQRVRADPHSVPQPGTCAPVLGARLTQLPADVFLRIGGNLDSQSLGKFSRTCKSNLNWTIALLQQLRASYPVYAVRPVTGGPCFGDLPLEQVLKFYCKGEDQPKDMLEDSFKENRSCFVKYGIPGALRQYDVLYLDEAMLFPECAEAICLDKGWKTLRVSVDDGCATNRFLTCYSKIEEARNQCVELIFNDDSTAFKVGKHGQALPVHALTLSCPKDLLRMDGSLTSVTKLAIFYNFFDEERNFQVLDPTSIQARLPNLLELSLESFHDEVEVVELLDLMPKIRTLVVSSVAETEYCEHSLRGVIRSGVCHLHVIQHELRADDFVDIAQGPKAGELESLHLLDCELMEYRNLEQLLTQLPGLRVLGLTRTTFADTDPEVWRTALSKLATKRNLRLEIADAIPLLS